MTHISYYANLHDANIARQAVWNNKDAPLDLTYRTNELAGEAGEAMNVLKKLERERRGMAGSRATRAQLAEELSDIVICVDLVAVGEALGRIGLPQTPPAFMADKRFDRTYRGNALAIAIGRVCIVAERVEENRRTDPGAEGRIGDRDRLIRRLHSVLAITYWIASCEGIDLNTAVADKFNATSVKVDLPVRMSIPGAVVELGADDTSQLAYATAGMVAEGDRINAYRKDRAVATPTLEMRALYEYFRPSGKWYASGVGAPIPMDGSLLTHARIKELNGGTMPGLSGNGTDFTIVVLDPTSFPRMVRFTQD